MSLRDATQTFVFAFVATLVLTGCQEPSAPPETAAETAARLAAQAPQATWVEITGADGAAVTLLGEGDRQLAHLACLSGPARVEVIDRTFTKVRSEERLTLGLDDEAFALVADLERETPGVVGVGTLDPALLDRLASARAISLVYGGQRSGPFEAPDAEVMGRFVTACRALAA